MRVLDLYERANRVPVLGRGAFSLAFGLKAPYFLTIAPTVLELEPNHAACASASGGACTTTSAPCT